MRNNVVVKKQVKFYTTEYKNLRLNLHSTFFLWKFNICIDVYVFLSYVNESVS